MAKLIVAAKGKLAETIAEVCKENSASSLAGGLQLAEGDHNFQVADKKAFGVLLVTAADGKNWALPIAAGKIGKDEFVLSDVAGAKTLVIPDQFITEMQAGVAYTITIGSRKGRKVVTNVVPAGANSTEEEDD